MNEGVLNKGWYSLWTQVGFFYGEFFLPILIAILCSYMWRLEHLHHNWNVIMTAPVSVAGIFLAKWIVVGVLLILVQLFFFVLYVLGGKLAGIVAEFPGELTGWLFRGWIASLAISSMQLALSMRIRSFAAPIGIGLCAVFIGLGMYVAHLGLFFPHSLLVVGMGILSPTSLSTGENFVFAIMNLFYILVFSLGSIYRLRKSDITAEM